MSLNLPECVTVAAARAAPGCGCHTGRYAGILESLATLRHALEGSQRRAGTARSGALAGHPFRAYVRTYAVVGLTVLGLG